MMRGILTAVGVMCAMAFLSGCTQPMQEPELLTLLPTIDQIGPGWHLASLSERDFDWFIVDGTQNPGCGHLRGPEETSQDKGCAIVFENDTWPGVRLQALAFTPGTHGALWASPATWCLGGSRWDLLLARGDAFVGISLDPQGAGQARDSVLPGYLTEVSQHLMEKTGASQACT